MNTLEEAKGLIHIEFGQKMHAIRLCLEIERDEKLRSVEIASAYFDKIGKPRRLLACPDPTTDAWWAGSRWATR